MNIYSIISLLASVICIFLGNFIYYKNPKNQLNKLIAILCIFVGFLAFTEFGYRQAENISTAYFWLKLSTLWPFVPALLLHISLIFTEKHDFLKSKMIYLVYLPAIILSGLGLTTDLIINGAVREYWGWTYTVPFDPTLFGIMSLWSMFGGFIAAALFFLYYSKTTKPMEKKQTKYIFIGLYIPLIISLISDLIFPLVSIRVPELTMTSITIGLMFIAYGIYKYHFPILTPAMAADKIIATMSNFLIILNPKKKILTVNNASLKLLGYSEEEIKGKPLQFIFKDEKTLDKILKNLNEDQMENGDVKTFETKLKAKNNKIIPVLLSVSGIKIIDDEPLGIVCIGSDLTEKKNMMTALHKTEELYKTLVKTDPDSVVTTDMTGEITYLSPRALEMHGYETSGELLGKNILELIAPQDHQKASLDMQKTIKRGILRNLEYIMKKKDGKQFIGELNATIIKNIDGNPFAFLTTTRDITHHKKTEAQIKSSLEEKDVLLKEIHHRVKNNLQIVSSLLNLQSGYIEDEEAQNVFKESQNRVKSMAMIHEKLYQSENFARINFGDYIKNLASGLFSSYGVNINLIKLKINVDSILLDINTAIPCGLILNELVTNSVKHAFPKGMDGEIEIGFFRNNNDENVLTVIDTGIGFPEDMDFRNTDTLGMRLITSLTDQIDGKLELITEGRTEFRITFR
jgi:PAS domain S-box-containing protein